MSTKVEAYRQLADRATGNLTAQATDWIKFLLVAGKCYKYRFLDQVMIYTQRPDATACAEFDLWTRRMNRHIRRGSKGIALLRYRDGRIFLRYVFDVTDTVRRENGRDPVLWQYKADYEPAVTSRLEECFKVPGGAGLARQLIALAVRFSDERWHDFGNRIMLSLTGSSLDGMDGDNVGLRFRNAATVSLSFLLLARCGLDLDSYFTPEDFDCIGEFDTRDTVLALGDAVSESAGVILRQVERAVKACMSGDAPVPPPTIQTEEHHPPMEAASAAGPEKPAAGSVTIPERKTLPNAGPVPPPGPEVAPPTAPGAHQEDAGPLAMPGYHGPQEALKTPPVAAREAPVESAPAGSVTIPKRETLPNAGPVPQPGPEVVPPAAPGAPREAPVESAPAGPVTTPKRETLPNAGPVPQPGPEAAPPAAPEPSLEATGQLAMPGYHGPQAALPEPPEAAQKASVGLVPATANFRITDDNPGSFGPKGRYVLNVEAIQTLRNVETEHRGATDVEQEMLARYTSWGAIPDVFDPDKPEWAEEYAELKSLLTEDEYASARASTLNAHFTPPIIIRAIYEALGNMGFTTGNVLEPSCGVGTFFGCLPESMAASRLYGIELDGVSGRIARLLYPKANIAIAGFETINQNDFYDVAVGNVPFGQYQVNDPAYNKHNFSIHNYFLCKMLDQLRPGGVMAVVTSRYTMDSKDSAARKYLAERADLLGAIRLPNTAFKSAGTDVVSDILFLQKLDGPCPDLPDWVSTMENQDGYQVNAYFDGHPEMVLGCPGSESTRYGHDYTVYPAPGADLAEQLHEAVARIRGTYRPAAPAELDDKALGSIPADPDVKNFSYTVVNGEVWFREDSVMVRPKLNATARARVKGMVQLRDCLQELIAAQMDELAQDSEIKAEQAELNRLYDAFTARYGLINSRGNRLAFDRDSSYYLLCSLEILNDDGNLKRKADIFTRRTIKQRRPVTHVDTAQEALAVSIGERARVDLPYMAGLTGRPVSELTEELGASGTIYKDPVSSEWQTADEYLSGNVRRKLREARRAAEDDPAFQPNVDALAAAVPKDLEASEIEVRLGATWISPVYIQQFMHETFLTPPTLRKNIRVLYAKATSTWFVTNKTWIPDRDVAARTTYGTDRRNAYEILEDTLNLRDVRVYDTVTDADGKDRRVLNVEDTTLAAQKQQMIKDAFKDWLWQDPDRRRDLVRHYNDTMNCIRPREYDGSNIMFHGI